MLKHVFSIKTRDGQAIESIQIYGKDYADAERKLRQMYHHCEITSNKTVDTNKTGQSVDIEELLSLISKHD